MVPPGDDRRSYGTYEALSNGGALYDRRLSYAVTLHGNADGRVGRFSRAASRLYPSGVRRHAGSELTFTGSYLEKDTHTPYRLLCYVL